MSGKKVVARKRIESNLLAIAAGDDYARDVGSRNKDDEANSKEA